MKTKIPAASRITPAPKPLTTRNITKQQAINTVSNLLYSAGLDVDSKVVKRQTKGELVNVLNMASIISRQSMQSMLGQSFNGKRDLYEVVGWKKELFFDDYLNMYERNGIAAAVVDIKADECWREFLVLHDGKTADDWQDDTPFLKAWLELVERLDLQSKFHELDVALGIGRFAIMVICVQGDDDYSKPLDLGGTKTASLIRVLDEGQVTLSDPVNKVTDPRYGLPNLYRCTFEDGGASIPVHWTRVIHFKQGRERSSVYGIPGLQKSYNSLMDLEKVSASSSEAFWQHIRRTLVLMAREGFNTPAPGTPEYEKLQDKMDALEHQMRQVIQLNNMDVQKLESSIVDGRAQHDLIIEDIAGQNRIPQRILTGSERGELASSQDILNMNNATAARQKKVCAPWVRDAVKHFYLYGIIPPPSSGKFQVEWNSLHQMTPLEKIELGTAKVEFLEKLTGGNIEQAVRIEDMVAETLDGYVMPEAEEPIEKEEGEDVIDEGSEGELAQGLTDKDEEPIG